MREPARPGSRSVVVGLVGALVAGLVGCNLTQEGEPPPVRRLNFPIALELAGTAPDGAAAYLLVANSNFDLRYNTGTMMSLDLVALRELLSDPSCQDDESCFRDEDGAVPESLVISEVGVGSHVDGIALSARGAGFPASDRTILRQRIYMPVRSERSLGVIELRENGELHCQQRALDDEARALPRCSGHYRRIGDDPEPSERGLILGGDPVALATGRLEDVGGDPGDGDFVLVALRDGRIGLFLDFLDDRSGIPGPMPVLAHVADGFPENLVTLTMQPGQGMAWMTSAGTDEIARVAIALDPNRTRSFLFDAGRVRVGGVDDGEDLRDLAFHPTEPEAYVLSRRPEAVVALDLSRNGLTSVDLGLRDVWEVGQGPSRLVYAQLEGRSYVLVSCFDAQKIFVIDVDAGSLVSVVGGLSGPFEIAVDEVSQHLYLTDFSTSVLRVIDLAPLAENETPRLVATIGEPFAPSGL